MNTIASDAINSVANAVQAIIIVRTDEMSVHVDETIGQIGKYSINLLIVCPPNGIPLQIIFFMIFLPRTIDAHVPTTVNIVRVIDSHRIVAAVGHLWNVCVTIGVVVMIEDPVTVVNYD